MHCTIVAEFENMISAAESLVDVIIELCMNATGRKNLPQIFGRMSNSASALYISIEIFCGNEHSLGLTGMIQNFCH